MPVESMTTRVSMGWSQLGATPGRSVAAARLARTSFSVRGRRSVVPSGRRMSSTGHSL